MEWMEIIRLRTQPGEEKPIIDWLSDYAEKIGAKPGISKTTVYSRAIVPGDVSIHIHWDAPGNSMSESEVGLMAAEALKKYGILDHTVWLAIGKNAQVKQKG